MQELLEKILSEHQLERIKNVEIKDRPHPVQALLCYPNRLGEAYENTRTSFHVACEHYAEWLYGVAKRLTEVDDFSTPSGCLGEIRALGYLHNAGFKVTALPTNKRKKTPDFHILGPQEEIIEVEVHSKQMNSLRAKHLSDFPRESPGINYSKEEKISITEYAFSPFEPPEEQDIEKETQSKDETTTENAIQRITSIKPNDSQFSGDKCSLLWLDFQDEIWNLGPHKEGAFPVTTWRGELFSGEIWYAFYGKQNLPIFENCSIGERVLIPERRMMHNGRFYQQTTKTDACIISFKRALIILENPYSKNRLPNWFFEKALSLRFFNINYSWIDWPDKNLNNRLRAAVEQIEALQNVRLHNS